jgi:hypothetical protein
LDGSTEVAHQRVQGAKRALATAAVVEDGDPPAGAVLTNAHLEALVCHADDDQADPRPRVEPAVEQLQLRRARRQAEEAEGGAEGGAALITSHG